MNIRLRKTKPQNDKKTIYIGFRLEPWLRHELDEIARRQERTVTQVVRHACKEYIERQKKAA